MTDAEFQNELTVRCYVDQISGYYLGHPGRTDFEPIVPMVYDKEGKLDREVTLDCPGYKFTKFQRLLLLDRGTDWRECLERARGKTLDQEDEQISG